MEVKPGKEGPEKYRQGRAHIPEIYKHSCFEISSRLSAFPSPPS